MWSKIPILLQLTPCPSLGKRGEIERCAELEEIKGKCHGVTGEIRTTYPSRGGLYV